MLHIIPPHPLPSPKTPCALAIGNFDGVHLGHQHLFSELRRQALTRGLYPGILTFEPRAEEFFSGPMIASPRLTSLREKAEAIWSCGIEFVACVHFNQAFSRLDPRVFIEQYLHRILDARYVLVGDDFRFGRDRVGGCDQLRQLSGQYGIQVDVFPSYTLDGERISSSSIRTALSQSDFELAVCLLGRPYGLSGRVMRGDQIGRTLGFPTANLSISKNRRLPLSGVYVVRADISGVMYQGVANVGSRPTLSGCEVRVEVHLFDFEEELYQKRIRVLFYHKLRNEQRFGSLEALRLQIERDCIEARAWFSRKKGEKDNAPNSPREGS